MVGKTGFEPATPFELFPDIMARPVGVEPATF